nr:hypothetical protein [uncultured Mogibacterium sp.]
MRDSFRDRPNGYIESIRMGQTVMHSLSGKLIYGSGSIDERIEKLSDAIEQADAIIIGAGAGLSTSAGFTYEGERFNKYFFDFAKMYGITDIYSGGFYPFPDEETRWAWWARTIYYNRYINAPKPVYEDLLKIVNDKDYFVVTTNVDHQFQRAGFDKKRLFYTQGDYGLFQSEAGQDGETYDNEEWVMNAMEAQGFVRNELGAFEVPDDKSIDTRIPKTLVPRLPSTGEPMTNNLRIDGTFVEDAGWHEASARYADFIRRHENMKVLFLELGVGGNTPVIIKFPFWKMAVSNSRSTFACINFGEAYCPQELSDRSICISSDIGDVLARVLVL